MFWGQSPHPRCVQLSDITTIMWKWWCHSEQPQGLLPQFLCCSSPCSHCQQQEVTHTLLTCMSTIFIHIFNIDDLLASSERGISAGVWPMESLTPCLQVTCVSLKVPSSGSPVQHCLTLWLTSLLLLFRTLCNTLDTEGPFPKPCGQSLWTLCHLPKKKKEREKELTCTVFIREYVPSVF